jgi:quercetin dioxygenase-like cupin family protein
MLLPAVAAAQGTKKVLPSIAKRFEDLTGKQNGGLKSFAIMDGVTHDGHHVEMHESELQPGAMPHPAHQHAHEEIFLLREGEVEMTISGKATKLNPGGCSFVASGELHGIKNTGTTVARYFVIAIGEG